MHTIRRFAATTAIAVVIATLCIAGPSGARADDATAFDDQTCPNVTSLGRKLNAIVDTSKVLTPELTAAAQAMVSGYRECVKNYDDNQYNQRSSGTEQVTNAVPVGRLYARLALARSLQRVAVYDADAKQYAAAKTAYAEAIGRLDEMKTIPAMDAPGDTPEHRLLTKGDDLKKDLSAAVAALPAG